MARTLYQNIKKYIRLGIKFKTLNPKKQETRRQNLKRKNNALKFIEGKKCAYCKTTKNLTIDHIIPRSKKGSRLKKDNWQVLCSKCNTRKADKIYKRHYNLLTPPQSE